MYLGRHGKAFPQSPCGNRLGCKLHGPLLLLEERDVLVAGIVFRLKDRVCGMHGHRAQSVLILERGRSNRHGHAVVARFVHADVRTEDPRPRERSGEAQDRPRGDVLQLNNGFPFRQRREIVENGYMNRRPSGLTCNRYRVLHEELGLARPVGNGNRGAFVCLALVEISGLTAP